MRDRSSGRPSFKEKPSNVRISTNNILTFDSFFGGIFDILTPKWLPTPARAQGGAGVKLTVLYAPQKDPDAFTKYYLSKHMPMVDKVPGVKKTEIASVLPAPKSARTALLPHHRSLFRERGNNAEDARLAGMEGSR